MKPVAIWLILFSLVGCVTQEKKAIDTAVSTQLNKKAVTAKSTCSSNQVIVEDGRLAGDSAGAALGIDASMSTAPELLSAELGRAGVVIAKTADADTTVVRVKRVYLSQMWQYESLSRKGYTFAALHQMQNRGVGHHGHHVS